MKGSAVVRMRSQHQMSTAFIRKTPNYPLLHTVFHLRQGKQRLLIRKAALSTIALTGAGHPRHRPASPPPLESRSWLAEGRRGCRKHGPHSARGRRPLTNRTERSSVPASRHRCRGRAVPTDGHPQSRLQERRARRAAAPRLPHTACGPRKRRLGTANINVQQDWPALYFFLLSFSLSSPAKPAIESSTSQIPVATRGLLRSSTPFSHIKTSCPEAVVKAVPSPQ